MRSNRDAKALALAHIYLLTLRYPVASSIFGKVVNRERGPACHALMHRSPTNQASFRGSSGCRLLVLNRHRNPWLATLRLRVARRLRSRPRWRNDSDLDCIHMALSTVKELGWFLRFSSGHSVISISVQFKYHACSRPVQRIAHVKVGYIHSNKHICIDTKLWHLSVYPVEVQVV